MPVVAVPGAQGATTVWERWDSLLPDGDVNPGTMTSFNHYALGAVADWLHRVVGGLAPAEPGYRVVRFAPQPGGGLTSATARHLTPYGEASISWRSRTTGWPSRSRCPWARPACSSCRVCPPRASATATHRRETEVPVPVG